MKFLACFELVVSLCLLYVKSESLKACKNAGHFALTFDDGPTEHTDEILNILKDNDVIATFFVLGSQVENKDLTPKVQKVFRQGHTVASHSYSHPDIKTLSDQTVIEEIKKAEDLIHGAIGKRPLFFRFPYLSTDKRVEDIVKSLGYYDVGVSVDSFDWRERTVDPENIYRNIVNGVKDSNPAKDSFISLHHDTTLPKLSKLPETIRFVREKGYKFVNMETCLGLKSSYKEDHFIIGENSKDLTSAPTSSASSIANNISYNEKNVNNPSSATGNASSSSPTRIPASSNKSSTSYNEGNINNSLSATGKASSSTPTSSTSNRKSSAIYNEENVINPPSATREASSSSPTRNASNGESSAIYNEENVNDPSSETKYVSYSISTSCVSNSESSASYNKEIIYTENGDEQPTAYDYYAY